VTRGAFIVLEGGEGSGKTTHARLLADRLARAGREVVLTFEPGATARGATWRAALLDDDRPLDDRAELLLLAADRAQHVGEVVLPALERGAVVVCDRHSPSTIVYQGVARGLGVDGVVAVCDVATGGLRPDAVIVLDVPDDVARTRAASTPDRIERAGDEFHDRVRAAYRELAPRFGWVVVDAHGTIDEVAERVAAAAAAALDRR
jgi:dTMP kinase